MRATTADDCVSEEIGDGFCDFELNNEVRRIGVDKAPLKLLKKETSTVHTAVG